MEPIELNAGRFHLRPLRHDDRVDDIPALSRAHGRGVYPEYFADAAADWAADRAYRWAVAEGTRVELLAELTVTPVGEDQAEIAVRAAGDPARVIEVDDPALPEVTVAEACAAAKEAATGWVERSLGRAAVAPRPYPAHPGDSRPVDRG